MKPEELRKAFLDFFEKKGHEIVASSSLIPADPTSLFTSAGMQQFVPYLSGKVKPSYKRACSIQKCFRTGDLDEVGDAWHHTFFEMLGNWSFGDYFKEGAIDFALEFLTKDLKIPKEKLWVSVFKGEKEIPKDVKSIKVWQSRGIKREKISEFGMSENFWGPVGREGPCGSCSEVFYDLTGKPCEKGLPTISGGGCRPNCECDRFVEIWNLVFMEYNKDEKGRFEKLPEKNVDTGIGFERLLAVLQGKNSDYETDLFFPIIREIQNQCSKKYEENKREFRILADHLRGAAFLISEGVLPSNVEQGYVLRRILRRSIRYAKILDLPKNWYVEPAKRISEIYGDEYPEVRTKQENIITGIQREQEKFGKALERGLKQFEKLLEVKRVKIITGKEVFDLYQNYGFPLELTEELAKEKGFKVDKVGFKTELKTHKEISRAGAPKKFGGIGIEQVESKEEREKAKRLHTATHLLQAALREILGKHVKQMGSDITPERLRFDFSHPEKLTPEEIKKVENLVNEKIREDLIVKKEEMSFKEVLKSDVLAFFKEKYPEKVTVYSIVERSGKVFSKEVCGGPHVERTSTLGIFKIVKESPCGTGVRRIRTILK